jgi:hypothetical protein
MLCLTLAFGLILALALTLTLTLTTAAGRVSRPTVHASPEWDADPAARAMALQGAQP